ncbi:MAG: aminotransferase class I/II-fold pyridoxal phosphate-dependent enzyme [Pseudomonadota bacterium]
MISQAELTRFVYETGSPFRRLDALLADVPANPDLTPINMTVGAPRHAPPDGVLGAITDCADGFSKYPPISGTVQYRQAVSDWIERRYKLEPGAINPQSMVLPLNGSREGLTLAANCARHLTRQTTAQLRPVVIMQNPFYQAYAVAALTAGADVFLLDDDDLSPAQVVPDVLGRAIAAYIASPTNPQGDVLSEDDWNAWIKAARTHDFFLFADECYSEIYRETPPVGALEVAFKRTGSADKVVSFNSLSKRSNLPGLRTGFAAGCPKFITAFTKLRNMGGPQVPLPILNAAKGCWADEAHVERSRALYQDKWRLVDKMLGENSDQPAPDAGFFLWLKLPPSISDIQASTDLWRDFSVRTIPGSYLQYPKAGQSNGTDRLRLALVDDLETTAQALERLKHFLAGARNLAGGSKAERNAASTVHAHKGH